MDGDGRAIVVDTTILFEQVLGYFGGVQYNDDLLKNTE
jgi:hypothetical protein